MIQEVNFTIFWTYGSDLNPDPSPDQFQTLAITQNLMNGFLRNLKHLVNTEIIMAFTSNLKKLLPGSLFFIVEI